jgi:hypothetical protein
MTPNNFLTDENINLLWEVLKEEEILKNQHQNTLIQIVQIFKNNLKGFYESEKNKCISLVDINKKYIIIILKYINKNYPIGLNHNENLDYQINSQPIINNQNANTYNHINPNSQSFVQTNKIQIHKEMPEKELITFEEFKKEKKVNFDKELNKLQEEFTNAMNIQVPPVPNFGDMTQDKPIVGIEEEIKKITAQRNYDIEQINKNYNSQHYDKDWLNSSGTSIKNDKLPLQGQPTPRKQLDETNIKYIKIENELLDDNIYKNQVIELNASKKNISWANNIVEEYADINNIYENNEINENYDFNEKSERLIPVIEYESELKQNILKKDINQNNLNEDSNLLSKFKKKPIDNNNNNNEINILKKEIENINNKIDIILNIIKKNEININ